MISPASAAYNTVDGSLIYLCNVGTNPPAYSTTASLVFPVAGKRIMFPSNMANNEVWGLGSISTANDYVFDGPVGLYVSYYMITDTSGDTWTAVGNVTNSNGYTCTYYNTAGSQGSVVGGPDVNTFTPAHNSNASESIGVTVKGHYEGSPELPIKNLTLTANYSSSYFRSARTGVSHGMYITSATIVEGNSTGDLEALEGIANQIANQSEILSAMYGDIMEVLNAIYSRLGDMQATMNLANSYFNSMVNYLNSINTNTSQIYSLLQSQFQLLIATINTASSDIQGAISKQTEDLKTYFDSVFNSAVGSLPDDTDSTQGVIDDAHENDEQYTADALGKFEEISATFQGFDGSVGSGVAVASTLFSRVWAAMGDYVIVYTFPLTLALALVIVGRLSRVHSKDSTKSKGGDDSG